MEREWKKIKGIHNYGYTTDNINANNLERRTEDFKANFQEKIINRIDFLYNSCKYVVIEENYIEREWKAMIAKHYINSAYSGTLKQSVIRVHFLTKKKFASENYLGFITLRPLDELEISLSFVYLNWNHSMFCGETTYVMTYKKVVHCMGESVIIDTYPFFAQDTIVTCCADANIIMLKKYFSNKYRLSYSLQNDLLSNKSIKNHNLPKKVDISLFKAMLSETDIPFRIRNYCLIEDDSEESISKKLKQIEDEILAYIESGLPVILGGKGHIIQIIGYVKSNDDDNTKFIVYDDSGYLEKEIFGKKNNNRHITYYIHIKDFFDCISPVPFFDFDSSKPKKMKRFFVALLEHERVYIGFEKYTWLIKEYLGQQAKRDIEKKYLNKIVKNSDKETVLYPDVKIRSILVDNSDAKTFLRSNTDNERAASKNDINKFLKKGLPHYLWYTEISFDDNKMICLFGNPTMYHDTKDFEKLFLNNRMNFVFESNKRLILLTEGK